VKDIIYLYLKKSFLLNKIPFGIVKTILEKEEAIMRALGIVGFKKSGKTTLTLAIAKKLINKGYNVAIIKHTCENINHKNTDSGKFMQEVEQVAIISPDNTEIIFRKNSNLKEIISCFDADFVLIEGFKKLKYFPKIVCLKKEDDKEDLNDGLALFTVSLDPDLKERGIADYLITEEADLEKMITKIDKKAFILPDMNCGKCGYGNCYGLAKAMVEEKETQDKCIYFKNLISIKINKKKIYLNNFMSELYYNLINGMLAPLKDIGSLSNAKIEIKLNSENKNKKNNSVKK